MDSLATHVAVSVLCHMSFGGLVLGEPDPHELEDGVSFFKADELEYVHVALKAHVQVFFALEAQRF